MCHRTAALISAGAVMFQMLSWPGFASGYDTSVIPSLTLEERYDTNTSFTTDSEQSDTDFITTAAPRVTLTKKTERFALDAYYGLDANYYSRNPDLDYIGHSAGADARADLTRRTSVSLGDRFDFTKDSLQVAPSGVLVVRTDITANTAYAELAWRAARRTSLELGVSDGVRRYDDPALIDSRADSATAAAVFDYSSVGKARLRYGFTNYRFNRPDGDRDIETHSLRAGIEEKLASDLTVDVSFGAVHAPGIDGNFFLTASGGFVKTYNGSSLSLAYSRDITDPTGLTDEISVSDRVGFEWTHMLGRLTDFTAYGGIGKNRSEPSGRIDLNSYSVGLTGSWRPYRWAELAAGLSHYQQWSGDDFGAGLTRNQVFVNVTFTGPEWRF